MKAVLIKTINRNLITNSINSTINNNKLCYIIDKLYIKYIVIIICDDIYIIVDIYKNLTF